MNLLSLRSAVSGPDIRSCDGCTACCKIMQIHELDKPGSVWCKHCNIGSGCRIYEERPGSCRDFECVWPQTQQGSRLLDLELRPDHSKVVISTTNDGNDIVLNVGTDRPEVWKHGATARLVSSMLADGITVVVKFGDKLAKL